MHNDIHGFCHWTVMEEDYVTNVQCQSPQQKTSAVDTIVASYS
jgi:hypothetical protein